VTLPADLPKTKEVRDLYWILKGPGLLNSSHPAFAGQLLQDEWFQELSRQSKDWFKHYDLDPTPLLDDLKNRENPTTLLGRYFEALVSFWIRNYLRPEFFRAGVPVHEREGLKASHGRRTIGEFDFLFRLAAQTVHWEASVKFYLFYRETAEQAREMSSYIGTFVRDRLDIKVGRMFGHQLKLSETPDGKAALAHLGLAEPQAKAWVKGMLFYPAQSDWKNHLYPAEVSPHHSRGWWTQADELDIPTQDTSNRWVLLPKYRWLSPVIIPSGGDPEQPLLTLQMMRDFCVTHFSEHLQPLMWAEVAQDQLTQNWCEVSRGLVVYRGWRTKARELLAQSSAEQGL
jgi:hypothetical protein